MKCRVLLSGLLLLTLYACNKPTAVSVPPDKLAALSLLRIASRPIVTPTDTPAWYPSAAGADPNEEKVGPEQEPGFWQQPTEHARELRPLGEAALPPNVMHGIYAPWMQPPFEITPEATSPNAFGETRRIVIKEIGLALEVPCSWRRGLEWSWSPPEPDGSFIGIRWRDMTVDWHPEAMFPPMSQIIASGPFDLGWTRAVSYTVRVSVPVAHSYAPVAVEKHVLVMQSERACVYDFFASAPNERQLATLESVYRHMLASVH